MLIGQGEERKENEKELDAGQCTTHPVDLQVKIKITPSFSSVLISRGDAEIRSRVNEIFLVALFEISTFLC